MDLETLIAQDAWPEELANLAREISAMAPGRARFDRIPELDAAMQRANLPENAARRLMAWQATWPDVRMITNDPMASEWGARFVNSPRPTMPDGEE